MPSEGTGASHGVAGVENNDISKPVTDIAKQAAELTNAWNKRIELGNKTPIADCFPTMTNKHAITIPATENISTEDVCRALATLISPQNIVACGKINGSILVYVKQEGRIPYICSAGLNIKDQHIPVTPLVKPSKKVIISNIRPDIPNSVLVPTLQHFGTMVSEIRPISANFEGPLQNVMSFRRYVFMNLRPEHSDLDVSFNVNHNNRAYRVYVSVSGAICFYCKQKNHIARNCPQKIQDEDQMRDDTRRTFDHSAADSTHNSSSTSSNSSSSGSSDSNDTDDEGFKPVRRRKQVQKTSQKVLPTVKGKGRRKNSAPQTKQSEPSITRSTTSHVATASHKTTSVSTTKSTHTSTKTLVHASFGPVYGRLKMGWNIKAV